ncbi:MAG: response regulator [Pseudomonadota bacterium]
MEDNSPLFLTKAPTARRPLLGLTILVVEDSRFACETMRLMCLRSGARIRRADSLKSARRHLKVYRPSAVIIDMGLPDGSGEDLIEELAQATPRIGALIGLSGDPGTETRAMHAGADGFIAKPFDSLVAFQQVILDTLPEDRRPSGPRPVVDDVIHPDPLAYRDDINHVANLLDDPVDGPTIDYVAQFLGGVARSAKDGDLANAAEQLARARAKGDLPTGAIPALSALLQQRLEQKIAI